MQVKRSPYDEDQTAYNHNDVSDDLDKTTNIMNL